MISFIKKITGLSNQKPVITNSIELVPTADISVSTPKEYICKLDRMYFNKTNASGINASSVTFKQNTLIESITLELTDKSTGSPFNVILRNVFNDIIDTITTEDKIKKSSINNNFYTIELNYIVNETSIITIDNIGSGKGSGIIYIKYFE